MEFYQAAVLCGTAVLILVLSAQVALPSFLALVLGSLFFAILSRMTLPSIGDTFSLGFAQMIDSFGLFIIAGCVVTTFLERSSAVALLPSLRNRDGAVIALGLAASLTPSAPVALALLRPWCLAAGTDANARSRMVTTLALAVSAGQAFIYPSLYMVAANAILKTDLPRMIGLGIAFAIITAVAGWLFVVWMTPRISDDAPNAPTARTSAAPSKLATILMPTLLPLVFLVAATFAQIPSEPLGRDAKELLVFVARPTIVLTLSLGFALLIMRRWDKRIISDNGWLGAALTASVRPLLAVGAAGGFVSMIQATGMAELFAEHITFLHLGIVVPFAAAALLKFLQGSPLVATLTAAGMTEPLLASLGLGGVWGPVLAALAIGAGTLLVHVNDPYFWLVSDTAGTTPTRTFLLYSVATLLQAICTALLLAILSGVLL